MGTAAVERKLTTIVLADIVGYSRMTSRDEAGTLAALKSQRKELIEPKIAQYGGRTIKLMGDGILMEFASVVDALAFAVEMQCQVALRNEAIAADQRLVYRIGINTGDIIVEGDDIYGHGVDVTARLEALADPGGICLSHAVYDHVKGKIDLTFQSMGEHLVKNIPEPVSAFRVVLDDRALALVTPVRQSGRRSRVLRPALAAALLAATLAGLGWWQPWIPEAAPATDKGRSLSLPDKPSLAVLPFDNFGGDPQQDYFAKGLTEDLITDLSKISGLFVVSRNAAAAYEGERADTARIAQALGVRYLIAGSVRRSENQVRITVQLIDGQTEQSLWAERYDRVLDDIFDMQDEVIQQITSRLTVRLTTSEQSRLARIPTKNLRAYDLYLQGEALLAAGSDEIGQALDHYAAAIREDPDFAEAHAGYAQVALEIWWRDYNQVLSGAVARRRALDSAGRALELDPENARAYAVLSLLQLLDGRHDQAIASARQAVELQPGEASIKANLALILAFSGEHEAAVDALAEALRHEPAPKTTTLLTSGIVYYIAGQYEKVVQVLNLVRQRRPNSETALEFLAAAYAQLGKTAEARSAIDKVRITFPHISLSYYDQFYNYYRDPADRAQLLSGLERAGVPEWPFGFQADEAKLVRSADLPSVVIDRTWVGELEAGGSFVQSIDALGRLAYRSQQSVLTGKIQLYGDQMCQLVDGYFLGRRLCGRIYRHGLPAEGEDYAYVYVGPDAVKYFSLSP